MFRVSMIVVSNLIYAVLKIANDGIVTLRKTGSKNDRGIFAHKRHVIIVYYGVMIMHIYGTYHGKPHAFQLNTSFSRHGPNPSFKINRAYPLVTQKSVTFTRAGNGRSGLSCDHFKMWISVLLLTINVWLVEGEFIFFL